MTSSMLAGIVALVVLLIVLSEIVSAVVPLLIVLACVPAGERDDLARLLATIDSSRRLRVWSALRLAVTLRRQELRQARDCRDPRRNPYSHVEAHFAQMADDAPVNSQYDFAVDPPNGFAVTSSPGSPAGLVENGLVENGLGRTSPRDFGGTCPHGLAPGNAETPAPPNDVTRGRRRAGGGLRRRPRRSA